MAVFYIKDKTTRPDGSAEVRVLVDNELGRKTVWGPFEYRTEAEADSALEAAYGKFMERGQH